MEQKIIHMADMHFDSAFSGLSETAKSSLRREDARATFSKIIDMAQNTHMLLISGDLFDSRTVTRTTLDFLKRQFERLGDVPVFIAAGNHDSLDDASVYRTFSFGENVHVFGTEPEVVQTEFADVYGASFCTANDGRALLPEFSVQNPKKINILVLHGNLAGTDYNPIRLQDIAECGMDYVALGHIHACSGIKKAGPVFYAYPGCPEGRGFDETGEKGVLALTVGKSWAEGAFVPLQQRMYLDMEIDVTGVESPEEILERVSRAFCGRQHIYRFRLTGQSAFPVDTEVLKSKIDAFDVSVRDETAPAADLEELSRSFTLKGLFAKYALAEKNTLIEQEFELAFKTGFALIEKEERNENR